MMRAGCCTLTMLDSICRWYGDAMNEDEIKSLRKRLIDQETYIIALEYAQIVDMNKIIKLKEQLEAAERTIEDKDRQIGNARNQYLGLLVEINSGTIKPKGTP